MLKTKLQKLSMNQLNQGIYINLPIHPLQFSLLTNEGVFQPGLIVGAFTYNSFEGIITESACLIPKEIYQERK